MATRLKYKKTPEGKLTTTGQIAKEDILVASYDPATLEYQIESVGEQKVIQSGKGVSPTMVKKHIKTALKTLGVNFADEVRNARIIA